MVLSDVDIKRYIEEGKIRIHPALPPEQFGSCSVDFRLGREFNVFEHSRHAYIDLKSKTGLEGIMRPVLVEPGEPFILQPREFVLAITEEALELADDVLGRLEGRSSLGRIGIIVHGTAGLFDPGWRGKATLELSNLSRMAVALYPGMRICSFTFEQVSTPVSMPYHKKPRGKYAGQMQPLASRLDHEVEELGEPGGHRRIGG
ncbi:MAG: dCTP deaminase [Acidobacteria bacterium]|nr:dCTP deaminase [Acidobacteriota bacterium]MBI3281413.1 dCTP deaminase [Acidobacteriota bacterium]